MAGALVAWVPAMVHTTLSAMSVWDVSVMNSGISRPSITCATMSSMSVMSSFHIGLVGLDQT